MGKLQGSNILPYTTKQATNMVIFSYWPSRKPFHAARLLWQEKLPFV
jgi:hypothetical protein